MRKALSISGWVILLGAVVAVGLFTQSTHKKLVCQSPIINIVPADVHFIDSDDVEFAIIDAGISLEGEYLDQINSGAIERVLLNMPHTQKVEVFTTINGELYVELRQRRPIARIIRNDGLSCYVDDAGNTMKFSNKHTPHVVVFTGNIPDPVMDWGVSDLLGKDSLASQFMIEDIYELARFIDANDFWKAQIQQVYVNEKHEMELIPRVGSHRIMLGNAEGLTEKFQNLMIFYEQGLGETSWNIYDTINLKYANQVVCSKR